MVILHTGSPGVDRVTIRRSNFKALCTSRILPIPTRRAVTKAVIMLWVREDFLGSDPTSQSERGAFDPIIIKGYY